MSELTSIRCEVEDRVATVWLHRPHRHNAWTGRMHAEFRQVMADLEPRDDVRAVVVTGTPPAFSVGGDSQALAGHADKGGYDTGLPAEPARPGTWYPGDGGSDPDLDGRGRVDTASGATEGADEPAGATLDARLDADMTWQMAYRHPIVAAVNGACAGVALALVAFCDLRFAASDAKLTTAAPKLGLPAEYGLSWILPRLIGVTRANDLLLSGRVVTGAETADWGLWNGVEADGEATLTAARDYARSLAATTGPNAVTVTKRQLAEDLLRHDPAASVGGSIRLLDEAMRTAEYREGVAALRDKRPPRF
jgi:enoyl-CoA hydratase/carnithine racemase